MGGRDHPAKASTFNSVVSALIAACHLLYRQIEAMCQFWNSMELAKSWAVRIALYQ
jgi:hypothetical protein